MPFFEWDQLVTLTNSFDCYFLQCYLAAMDNTDGGQRKSVVRPVSTASSANDLPPPPVEKPEAIQAPQSPEFGQDEFDDDLRCSVLYDFSGKNFFLLTVHVFHKFVLV